MLRALFAAVVLCGLLFAAEAGAEVRLGPRMPVTPLASRPFVGYYALSISPDKPQSLIACGARLSPDLIEVEGFVSTSSDGGQTWIPTLTEKSSRWVTEESCVFGKEGRAYFFAGVSNTSWTVDHQRGQGLLYRSTDGGETWAVASRLGFLDWTRMDVGPSAAGERLLIFSSEATKAFKWGEFLPNLTVSGDGGSTVSAPTGTPRRENITAVFPLATDRFRDGSVVTLYVTTAKTTDVLKPSQRFEISVTAPADRTITKLSPAPETSAPTFDADVAVDPRTDALHVAWIEEADGVASLMLATSADRGASWTKRALHRTQSGGMVAPGRPSIAVDKDGIVGLLWPGAGGSCVRFASSRDGARTFGPPAEISPCRPPEPQDYDDLRQYVQLVRPVHETLQTRDGANRVKVANGVSFILNTTTNRRQTALEEHPHGGFIASWIEKHRGVHGIWARTIALGKRTVEALPGVALCEVTKDVDLELYRAEYDLNADQFFVDVVVRNKSGKEKAGPIWLKMGEAISDFGELKAANADLTSGGAIWRLWPAEEGPALGAWRQTRPRKLAFSLVRPSGKTDMRWNFGPVAGPAYALGMSSEMQIFAASDGRPPLCR